MAPTTLLTVPGSQTELCAREPDCDPVRRGHALAATPAFTIQRDVERRRALRRCPKDAGFQAPAVSGDERRTAGATLFFFPLLKERWFKDRVHDVAAGSRDAKEVRPHGRHPTPTLTDITGREPSAGSARASATTAHAAISRTRTPMPHRKERWFKDRTIAVAPAPMAMAARVREKVSATSPNPMVVKEKWFRPRAFSARNAGAGAESQICRRRHPAQGRRPPTTRHALQGRRPLVRSQGRARL